MIFTTTLIITVSVFAIWNSQRGRINHITYNASASIQIRILWYMIQSSNANHANVFFAIHGVSLIEIFYHISTSVFHVIALWVMSLDGLENNLRPRLRLRISRRLEISCDQGRKTIWYLKSQDSAASLIETEDWDNRYTLTKT